MATIKNEIDKTLQAYSPSRLTVTAVTINSLSSSFLKAKNTSTISPSQIELIASIVGFTTPTYTWYYSTSTNLSTWIAISTGINLVVTNTLYNTHITSSTGNTFIRYKVVASQTGWTTAETYFDINYNQETNDLPVLTFSKDSIALPTTNADICTYTGASTDISVSIGGAALSYATTGANTFNVTVGTLSGTGVVTASTAGTVQTYTISGMNGTGLTATLNIPFTITARDARGAVTTFTKNIFVSKVTSGTAGVPGPAGDVAVFAYYVISSASLPASPTITQNATPAFGAVAAYNTWYLQPKATLASSDWQFQISGTKSIGGTYTWESSLTGYLSTFKVGALSALSADLGTVTAGTIDTTGYINAKGGIYPGAFFQAGLTSSGTYNSARTSDIGLVGYAKSSGSSAIGVIGATDSANGVGVYAYAATAGTALYVQGPASFTSNISVSGGITHTSIFSVPITTTNTALCTGLNANYLQGNLASAFYLASNPNGYITSASLSGYYPTSNPSGYLTSSHFAAADHDARYPHYWPCDSGAAYASNGMQLLTSGIGGVRTRGTGNAIFIEAFSDARLKQDIEPETLGLNFVNALRPVTYRVISSPDTKCHGFIAQDLGEIIEARDDALYQTHDDGTLGVDYMSLVAPLVKAVQELTLRIKILENK